MRHRWAPDIDVAGLVRAATEEAHQLFHDAANVMRKSGAPGLHILRANLGPFSIVGRGWGLGVFTVSEKGVGHGRSIAMDEYDLPFLWFGPKRLHRLGRPEKVWPPHESPAGSPRNLLSATLEGHPQVLVDSYDNYHWQSLSFYLETQIRRALTP